MKAKISCESYNIFFGPISQSFDEWFSHKNYSNVFVLVDENTHQHCLPLFLDAINVDFHVIEIPSGEQHKTLHTCQEVWDSLIENSADRNSLMINLGGGVIGDLGGYVSSSFMRGFDFIQIPTTLLAQADASVGGKLGIDYKGLKNYIGTFQFPKAVFIDVVFLETLQKEQISNGFAEVIKHALIRDQSLWIKLKNKQKLDTHNITDLLFSSISIKQIVVSKDPRETGLRKILNFGHSIGHAIESYFLKSGKELLHGYAVVAGMFCESFISYQKGILTAEEWKQISDFLSTHFDKVPIKENAINEIQKLVGYDKKNQGDKLLFTLLHGIGNCKYDQIVNIDEVGNSLNEYLNLNIPSHTDKS